MPIYKTILVVYLGQSFAAKTVFPNKTISLRLVALRILYLISNKPYNCPLKLIFIKQHKLISKKKQKKEKEKTKLIRLATEVRHQKSGN